MRQVESLRRRQNQMLLAVLEQEQTAEDARERSLAAARDAAAREALETSFRAQRSAASDRIMRLTEDHERALASKMQALGL